MRNLFKAVMQDVLFIEENPSVARSYRVKEQLRKFQDNLKNLILTRRPYIKNSLKKGFLLNEKAARILQRGPAAFKNLPAAMDFLIDVALYATVLPHQVFTIINDHEINAKGLCYLAEKLRMISYYPSLTNKIVLPLAKDRLKSLGVHDVGESLDLITLHELIDGKAEALHERRLNRNKKLRFMYQDLNGKESVSWVSEKNVIAIIAKLENLSLDTKGRIQLHGQSAFLGKVKGIARIVLTPTGEGVNLKIGEILISIQSSPTLMPLLRECSAIVTDEGGIACHAAIISRELRKPCVIGTRVATSVLKDGDLIEVDANKGVVKILKRAQ
ncbi:MAG: hypothetical protein A3J67_01165 [Parcubacteria group bacterium RIFCSPHIGHO2_02_FULL_48_10b]|nr:MAG: hypothetical protein A3J67_01165 [Parcubacteria group bacterium RIFCSPHIGHO2_02_FULL_48_10b]